MTSISVEHPRSDDLEELVALFDGAFSHDHAKHRFVELMPNLYLPQTFQGRDHLVVRDGGELVAGLALLPLEYAADGNRFSVAGIGQVSTRVDARGRGLMTALMQEVEAQMDRDGVVLGYLGGDRMRYSHYGFETAGCGWGFDLQVKDLSGLDLSGWSFREPEDLEDWMCEAIEVKPYRLTLPRKEAHWAVRRGGGRVLAVEGPGGRGVVAYDTSEVRQLDEWVGVPRLGTASIRDWGGDTDAVIALVGELARTCDGGQVGIRTPAVGDELSRRLGELATRSFPRVEANLRIGRLQPLLEAFRPWMSRAAGSCPEGLSLRMKGTDQHATLRLDAGGARVVEEPGRDEICLTRCQMARFLFGPFSPSRQFDVPARLNWLDMIFPLPWYVSGLTWV